MTSARSIFRSHWQRLLTLYRTMVFAIATYGILTAESQWFDFEQGVLYLLLWADLISAASIRYKALHQRTIIPHGERATLPHIADANEWYALHAAVTQPIIEKRVQTIADTERGYLAKKENAIAQMVRPANFVEDFVPLWRLERMRTTAVAEVANLAEQVQLAATEINDAFPFARYWSRDDARVRPTHRSMHGFWAVRSYEHWPLIVPPAGFNCRCFTRYVARHEAIDAGWMNKSGRILKVVHWPNTLAEKNFKEGRFPDKGWREPRTWTWPGSGNAIAA